jgi:hypothetical protein
LPVALPDRNNARLIEKLAQLASERDGVSCEQDAAIDRVVYELYRLTAAEIETIKGHVAQAVRRAA